MLVAGLVLTAIFVLCALLAPWLAPYSYSQLSGADGANFGAQQPPSAEHLLGTTVGGYDVLSRVIWGAQTALMVVVVAIEMSVVVGIVLGLVSGYLGGWVDKTISWFIDFMLSLPFLLMVLAIVPIVQKRFTPSGTFLTAEETSSIRFWVVLAILGLTGWLGLARLIRGEVFSLREREFVQAARVIGVPTRQILFREILPNLVGPIIVSASIAVPAYIASEATLSYLGAGLVEPTASWGRTVSDAQNSYARYPLFLWPPVLSIASLVLALSLLGDSIRDAFDPNTRR